MPAGVDSSAPGWSAYGLGVQVLRVDGRTLVGHGGSMPGFLAGVFVDREEQTGAVSLANTTAGLDAAGLRAAGRPARRTSRGSSRRGRPRRRPVPLDCLGDLVLGPVALRAARRRRRDAAPRAAARAASAGPAASPQRDGAWVGLDGYFAGETLRIAEDHLDLDTFVFTRTPYDPEAPVPGGVDERGWR